MSETLILLVRRAALFTLFAAISIVLETQAQEWEWQNPVPRGYLVNDIVATGTGTAVAVCDRGFVQLTYDTGRTWYSQHIVYHDLQRVLAFPSGDLIAAGEDGLLLTSTDGGWLWTERKPAVAGANGLADLARIDDSSALAKTGPTLLLVTRDRGISWSPIQVPVTMNDQLRSIAVQSPGRWFAVGNRSVYRTDNAGLDWAVDSSYAARGMQRLVFIDSSYGYQLRDGQVVRTHDGGATWKEMDVYGFDYHLRVFAGPALGDAVYVLSEGEYIVNKSTDGGETWNISLTGAAFPNAYPIAGSFVNAQVGYIAGEGGRILRTSDGGQSWAIVMGAGFLADITGIHFTNEQNGIALTYTNSVLVTSNGGRRWDEAQPSTRYSIRGLSMYGGQAGYAFGLDVQYSSALFHTSNNGHAWEKIGELPLKYTLLGGELPEGILALSRDTILVGSSAGNLYLSRDAGVQWDSIYVSDEFQFQFAAGELLYFFYPATILFTGSGGVAISTDMGENWTYHRSPSNSYLRNVQFFSPTDGVALASGTSSGTATFTTNSGRTWNTRGSERGFERLFFFDALNGYATKPVTTGRTGVYSTSDGGTSWSVSPMKEGVYWNGWYWLTRQKGWAYGPGGEIRHSGTGGITGLEMPAPAVMEIGSPYPNPVVSTRHAALTIPFTVGAGPDRSVSLSLHDMLGRRIVSLPEAIRQPGRHAAVFDLRTLPPLAPGLYHVRLLSGAVATSRAVVVTQ